MKRSQALLRGADGVINDGKLLVEGTDRIPRFVQYRNLNRSVEATVLRLAALQRQNKNSPTVIDTLKKLEQPVTIPADKLKSETSPSIVLEDAVIRFGIRIEDYSITSSKDGTPRIRHADKHYNLGDFYTKHIGIPWGDAEPMLQSCYNATLSDDLPPPDKALWKSFSAWRDADYASRSASTDAIKAKLRAELVDARSKYKAAKLNSRQFKGATRQTMLARARAEQLVRTEAIKAHAKKYAQDKKRPHRNAHYRAFLNDLASKGNVVALAELRRMAKPELDLEETITGAKSKTVFPLPSYKIDHNGKVTYYQNNTSMVADSITGVSVLRAESAAYEIALKIAVARYGKDLTFKGDQEFMRNMIEAARKSGMQLSIKNAEKPREAALIFQKQPQHFTR